MPLIDHWQPKIPLRLSKLTELDGGCIADADPVFYPSRLSGISDFFQCIRSVNKLSHRYIHVFSVLTRLDGIRGEAASTNAGVAFTKAIFEAMERYFATQGRAECFTYGRYSDLAPLAANPELFGIMTDWEYENAQSNYPRYTPSLPLHWYPCFEVHQLELVPRLVPATMAVLRHSWTHPGERFVANLSAGAASAAGYERAIIQGIYECVERDAFMVVWLNKLACPVLSFEQFPCPSLAESYERLTHDGFECAFINITTDVQIPVTLCVITSDPRVFSRKLSSVGIGASLDPHVAFERAFEEALEVMPSMFEFSIPGQLAINAFKNTSLSDIEKFYRYAGFLGSSSIKQHALEFLASVPQHDQATELGECLQRLDKAGVTPYIIDLTPRFLADNTAYRLVRTLCAGLQPQLYESDSWRLSQDRVSTAPVRMGILKEPKNVEDMNFLPNPMAFLDSIFARERRPHVTA